MDVIQTWAGLSARTGIPPKALNERWRRGTLPLTERWSRGQRVFDLAEVEAWIAAGMPKKQH